jgi:hypothetical protein
MPNGQSCTTDAECLNHVCAPMEAFGLQSPPAGAAMCTKSCCDDRDCVNGEVCWASRTGVKLCVAASVAGVTSGTGGPLATCGGNGDCRSGFCGSFGMGSVCASGCADDAYCGSGNRCTTVIYDRPGEPDFVQLLCGPGSSGLRAGSDCLVGAGLCRYGLCLRTSFPAGLCSGPCRSHSDCGSSRMYCGTVGIRDPPTGRIDRFRECRLRDHPGMEVTGAACNSSTQCWDFACLDTRCADACCSDAQCPGGYTCRPRRAGDNAFDAFCVPT